MGSGYQSSYYGYLPSPHSYSPRRSMTSYRSGDDSERSYHSSSSSRRRRCGISINRQIIDPGHRSPNRDPRERILLVDNPPTPRTPPQAFAFPRSAPSSPSFPNTSPVIIDASPRGCSPRHSGRRPVIVDERQRHDRTGAHIHVEVSHGRRKGRRAHRSSTSSHESRHSMHGIAEVEELRRCRRQLEEARQGWNRPLHDEEEAEADEQLRRQLEKQRKIDRANREIASRPAVPLRPVPFHRSSTSTGAKTAHFSQEREDELLDRIRDLDIKDKRHFAPYDEDAAQRDRLLQRMVPRRRATVGPGSRRHRVQYDEGVYRWE